MYDINTRINATIPYFFLGPFLLLARAGTPLAHPFVQVHARAATKIIGFGILGWIVYFFTRQYLLVGFLGITLESIVLILLMTTLIGSLILGAYRAYSGLEPNIRIFQTSRKSPDTHMIYGIYSEEAKIRIILAFIPFVGIFLSKKYSLAEIHIARKVGSLFATLCFMSLILFGSVNSLFFFSTLMYLALIATTAVHLIHSGNFLMLGWYQYIPSYHEIEAHIQTVCMMSWQWIRVAFGGEKQFSYTEKYQERFGKIHRHIPPTTPYWTHTAIIALPGINLLTIPSIFQKKYSQYRLLIIEGLAITLLLLCIWFFPYIHTYFLYFLLFPLATLLAEGRNNLYVRAPITSIFVECALIFDALHTSIENIQGTKQEERYTYPHNNHHP